MVAGEAEDPPIVVVTWLRLSSRDRRTHVSQARPDQRNVGHWSNGISALVAICARATASDQTLRWFQFGPGYVRLREDELPHLTIGLYERGTEGLVALRQDRHRLLEERNTQWSGDLYTLGDIGKCMSGSSCSRTHIRSWAWEAGRSNTPDRPFGPFDGWKGGAW